jgi:hypothetical protein
MLYLWAVIGTYLLTQIKRPFLSAACVSVPNYLLAVVFRLDQAGSLVLSSLAIFGFLCIWFWIIEATNNMLLWIVVVFIGVLVQTFILPLALDNEMACNLIVAGVVLGSVFYFWKWRREA